MFRFLLSVCLLCIYVWRVYKQNQKNEKKNFSGFCTPGKLWNFIRFVFFALCCILDLIGMNCVDLGGYFKQPRAQYYPKQLIFRKKCSISIMSPSANQTEFASADICCFYRRLLQDTKFTTTMTREQFFLCISMYCFGFCSRLVICNTELFIILERSMRDKIYK